ncbi:MAG: diguanylate cyclase [Deltaproteobacteria bacterium]|jgi:diguanylate cyclase (GGDEF)-like protein|nr:diguanylate cyclase [Deltaproteobacteria bacterium]
MKNPFRSLPARIVAFVFAAITVTSLAVMGLSVHSTESFLRSNINRKFPDLLATSATRLDDWYEQRRRELDVFSESDVLQDNLAVLSGQQSRSRLARAEAEISQYLSYVLDGFPQYRTLFILGAEGEVELFVGEPVELSASQREHIAQVDSTRISDMQVLDGVRAQVGSAPLFGVRGKRLGSLHAIVPVDALADVLAPAEFDASVQILLVGSGGRYVLTSDGRSRDQTFQGPMPEDESEAIVHDYEGAGGERVVGASRKLARFGWTLVVEQPYEEAFAPVYSALGSIVAINLAIVLAVVLGGFRIAVSIVRPIEALSTAAKRISEGERDVVIPDTQSSDEVGVLTRAFSDMTMRLTNNAAELEASHAAVEEANERLRLRNEELHRVNEVLEQLSITDGLTKLHNHRYFQEVLLQESKRAGRSGKPLSLVLIDIDYFKRWNDRLGHAAGDEILRRLALVMMELVRETDLLARYGGEEFALITPDTDQEGALQLAEKIRNAVSHQQFLIDAPSEREAITVSIGVSSYEGDRVAFFNAADRALYAAKESGRDCVVCASNL